MKKTALSKEFRAVAGYVLIILVYFAAMNIASLIVFHAFTDFCGLFGYGFFGEGSPAGIISSYKLKDTLIFAALLIIITAAAFRRRTEHTVRTTAAA